MDDLKKLIADIGNTNTHIALFEGTTPVKSVSLANSELSAKALNGFFGPELPAVVLAASVNKAGLKALHAAVMPAVPKLLHSQNTTKISLPPEYTTIGVDRLANMAAALEQSNGKAAIVIDAGTALTVDLVMPDSSFAGGYIFPGHDLCFKALGQGTCQLDEFNSNHVGQEPQNPGMSTRECIVSGVANGLDGTTQHLVRTLQQRGGSCIVFVTGGAARFLTPQPDWIFDPLLTLKGIGLCLE